MKKIFMTIIFLALSSCHFGSNYEMESYFPVEIKFVNQNNGVIHIENITSSAESDRIFLVEGENLKSGEVILVKFNFEDADSVKDGYYVIEGRCANDKKIPVEASSVDDSLYQSHGKISVLIRGCE